MSIRASAWTFGVDFIMVYILDCVNYVIVKENFKKKRFPLSYAYALSAMPYILLCVSQELSEIKTVGVLGSVIQEFNLENSVHLYLTPKILMLYEFI